MQQCFYVPGRVGIIDTCQVREGDTVLRVFGAYKDAVTYADELTAEQKLPLDIDYDVFEREVY